MTWLLIIIVVLLGLSLIGRAMGSCPKGGSHAWEYKGTYGITFQKKICTKCGKIKIVEI